MKAKLAFYFSFSNEEIESMPWSAAQSYFLSIDMILAEKTMTDLTVASFPNMKRSQQKEVEARIKRVMRGNMIQKSGTASTKDLYEQMVGKLSGR